MTANPIPISPLSPSSFDSFSNSDRSSLKYRHSYPLGLSPSATTTTTIAEVILRSPPSLQTPTTLPQSQPQVQAGSSSSRRRSPGPPINTSQDDFGEPLRGRDSSPRTLPNLHSPSISPIPLARSRRSSHAQVIEAHHHLPSTAGGIPSDPVLYLPPLLSPLPYTHSHSHSPSHDGVGAGAQESGTESRRSSASSLSSHGTTADGRPRSIPVAANQEIVLNDFRTRLPNIDPASLALHQVLHHFRPIDGRYARTSYDEAFNWEELLLPTDIEREWYCVVFRSRRKPESSNLSLYTADREAHEEAVKNGGLVMYWYGVPDSVDGSNLATCIWQSRRHAVNAISGPKHRLAMQQAQGAYEVYDLERWIVRKEKGERGLSLSTWQGGEVGW